jgi:perosamine synthetase
MNNGSPIPYGRQWLDAADVKAVVAALKSDWLTQGPRVAAFEDSLAAYCGSKYAVAVANGTAALHLACLALGLKQGAGVLTTPNTFVASANCALYAGLTPHFADIEDKTFCIDPERMEAAVKKNKGIKAVIPVHFAGHPCDMKAIREIADRHGLRVIEDACHALGAGIIKRGGVIERVGSCRGTDMAVLSFHPVKHITTGEGGAILTNDPKLYKKLVTLRTHGITKEGMSKDPGPWYYEMVELGYNYRITDIQCALGASQLKKVEAFVNRRREIAAIYNEAFSGMDSVRTVQEKKGFLASYHLYVIQADFKAVGKTRKKVMEELVERGVRTQVHYIPVHLQPYYKKSFGYKLGDFPVAEGYYEKALSLPMFPKMTGAEVRQVVRAVKEVLG